jgi:hypothetical protein
MITTNPKRGTTVRIPPAVVARIVELSMQHPEFGAKRLLPLLKKEAIAISASSIYNILKRHGLQNREKRFAVTRARQAAQGAPPQAVVATAPPPAEVRGTSPGVPRTEPRSRQEDRRPALRTAAVKSPFPKGRPASGKHLKIRGGIPLTLKLVGVSMLAVIVYAGFHAMLNIRRLSQVPQTTAEAAPAPSEEPAGETVALTQPAGVAAIPVSAPRDIDSPPEPITDPQPPPTVSWLPPYLSRSAWPAESPWAFSIGFEEVEAWIADARRLWQDATLDPYLKDNLPAGFTITGLQPDAIYKKMGLQNGDVIQSVNGEPITGPEAAVYFFQKIAEGGVVEIKIKRHRRNRYISLTIQ